MDMSSGELRTLKDRERKRSVFVVGRCGSCPGSRFPDHYTVMVIVYIPEMIQLDPRFLCTQLLRN